MLLKASSALSLPSEAAAAATARVLAPAASSSSLSSVLKLSLARRRDRPSLETMATREAVGHALTGVVFDRFEELRKELCLVPSAFDQSLARQKYDDDCEAAINEQIKKRWWQYLILAHGRRSGSSTRKSTDLAMMLTTATRRRRTGGWTFSCASSTKFSEKVSWQVRKAVMSVLPVPISTKLARKPE